MFAEQPSYMSYYDDDDNNMLDDDNDARYQPVFRLDRFVAHLLTRNSR